MKIMDVITSSLSSDGTVSEKRVNKMVITVVLLGLTIADFFMYAHGLRIEILGAWLTIIGYDSYRITKEKKDKQQAEIAAADKK